MSTTTSDPDIQTLDIYYAIAGVVKRPLASLVCVYTYQDSNGCWIQCSHMLGDKELKMIDGMK